MKSLREIRQTEFVSCACGYCDELIPRLTARGKIARFKKGHNMFGKVSHMRGRNQSEEAKEAMRLSKLEENNPNWIGDSVGYSGVHTWIKRRLPKPDKCENCNTANTWLDLACVTGIYSRDLSNWKYLCRTCHMESDGRMTNFRLKTWRVTN